MCDNGHSGKSSHVSPSYQLCFPTGTRELTDTQHPPDLLLLHPEVLDILHEYEGIFWLISLCSLSAEEDEAEIPVHR